MTKRAKKTPSVSRTSQLDPGGKDAALYVRQDA
jgi:hypothetical protein